MKNPQPKLRIFQHLMPSITRITTRGKQSEEIINALGKDWFPAFREDRPLKFSIRNEKTAIQEPKSGVFHIPSTIRITIPASSIKQSKDIIKALYGTDWFPASHLTIGLKFSIRIDPSRA
jgi:hypothetical protein